MSQVRFIIANKKAWLSCLGDIAPSKFILKNRWRKGLGNYSGVLVVGSWRPFDWEVTGSKLATPWSWFLKTWHTLVHKHFIKAIGLKLNSRLLCCLCGKIVQIKIIWKKHPLRCLATWTLGGWSNLKNSAKPWKFVAKRRSCYIICRGPPYWLKLSCPAAFEVGNHFI